MKRILISFILVLLLSCHSNIEKTTTVATNDTITNKKAAQIAEYVLDVFEDSKGVFWFGTLQKGVARYDGNSLTYLTIKDGLPSNAVVSILEDSNGVLWFGTQNGLSKYENGSFTNYSEQEGLCNASVSTLLIDSKNRFWVGTWGGVCLLNGSTFSRFDIPDSGITTFINSDTKNWVTEIMEDSSGNIWIGRDGYGATKFDGQNFVNFTKNDGLHANTVTEILEGTNGDIWFGARVAEKDYPEEHRRKGAGGVCKLNGNQFVYFHEIAGLSNADTFELFKDSNGNIWLATTRHGVYRFDGKHFVNFDIPISVVKIIEDKKGKFWLAGAGGLYTISQNGSIENITVKGPWQ